MICSLAEISSLPGPPIIRPVVGIDVALLAQGKKGQEVHGSSISRHVVFGVLFSSVS
jgi:hypothetical protein